MDKILFPFRFRNLEDVISKPLENPKEFMYGSYELMQKYGNIGFFLEPRGLRNTLLKKILFYFERPFSRIIVLGMPHEVYLCNSRKYTGVKKLVCINDAISFAVLFWKMMGCITADVYAIFQSLPERHLKYFPNRKIAVRFIAKLLTYAKRIMVLSSAAKYELTKAFGVPLDRIEVFHFGADLSFWKYREFNLSQRSYILTIGNDINRDYDTFTSALAGKYEIIAVTSRQINHPQISCRTGLTNHEMMGLYHGARLVVTPSVKLLTESSGLSTTVQAMASGSPVVISDSLPMRELFRESEHVFYYEPENPQSLADAVTRIWNDEKSLCKVSWNARKLIENKLNSQNMALQLERNLGLV